MLHCITSIVAKLTKQNQQLCNAYKTLASHKINAALRLADFDHCAWFLVGFKFRCTLFQVLGQLLCGHFLSIVVQCLTCATSISYCTLHSLVSTLRSLVAKCQSLFATYQLLVTTCKSKWPSAPLYLWVRYIQTQCKMREDYRMGDISNGNVIHGSQGDWDRHCKSPTL